MQQGEDSAGERAWETPAAMIVGVDLSTRDDMTIALLMDNGAPQWSEYRDDALATVMHALSPLPAPFAACDMRLEFNPETMGYEYRSPAFSIGPDGRVHVWVS